MKCSQIELNLSHPDEDEAGAGAALASDHWDGNPSPHPARARAPGLLKRIPTASEMENPDPAAHMVEDDVDVESGLGGSGSGGSPTSRHLPGTEGTPIKVTPKTEKIFKKMLSWSADTMVQIEAHTIVTTCRRGAARRAQGPAALRSTSASDRKSDMYRIRGRDAIQNLFVISTSSVPQISLAPFWAQVEANFRPGPEPGSAVTVSTSRTPKTVRARDSDKAVRPIRPDPCSGARPAQGDPPVSPLRLAQHQHAAP
ncbi:tRNA-specific 2-thiouridylase [Frankliniella fusca]|uniref:tRNA-specific 2-thiouridylase n=1 Tax=Frankliniella fusca TaxID=407009 RepID=A0AAE1I4X6_9NEOP|nr:tRNA-specific 2-thiouridylase [Frankliniella fusca]